MPRPRAYHFTLTGRDGTTATAVIDLLDRPYGYTMNQATSDVLYSVIEAKGPQWLQHYKVVEIE